MLVWAVITVLIAIVACVCFAMRYRYRRLAHG
jgi:hypothetical protein